MLAKQYSETEINRIFEDAQKFSDEKQFAKAEKNFEFLLKAAPNQAHVLSAFSKLCADQKKMAKAEKLIKAAIKLAPNDAFVLLDLAAFHASHEDFRKYKQTLVRVLAIDPDNSLAIKNLTYHYLLAQDFDEFVKLQESIQLEKLEPENLAIFQVTHAIFLYLKNDISGCKKLLEHSAEFFVSEKGLKLEAKYKERSTYRIYSKYMLRLLEWREKNPAYENIETEQEAIIIGDSHSFCHANFSGIETKLMLGTTIRKLAVVGDKLRVRSFKKNISELDKNKKIILSFGEIDCRAGLGIHKNLCKNPDVNLEESVRDVVEKYVSFAMKYASRRGLQINFLNCPAPLRRSVIDKIGDPEKEEEYKIIPQIFNKLLAETAHKSGAEIIDIYTATHAKNGWGNPDVYLDDVHLHPSILIDLLAKKP